ncbi:MAG: response regulator transcription factor [Crocinitomicaceae bacterium]|jgi:DNA-binding NarL/FixJ family response regulator|nr:response regulator transcription factor [Crocinitomicaceae bacterium]MBT5404229.1 response regulator transcription factor [Crocinitomicaceae bacterium]MBT6029545.1 response regulator transcription factor [Crocinitomicaceae bacterium]MBT6515532.1 response regulator transcription factor [Crocinitomicaceae bacterium]
MIKILIVDDHTMFLNGLASLLKKEKDIELIGTAETGHLAIQFIKEHNIDVVISDLSMPGMSGQELLQKIQLNYPDVKFIALSMHYDGKTISEIIKIGARGYLPKDADKKELLEAIRGVATGDTYFGDRAKRAVLNDLIPVKEQQKMESFAAQLTDREKEILVLIAEENTQEEIAEKLFISSSTVVYHKRKLMAMLEVKGTAGLVRKAGEMGLLKK